MALHQLELMNLAPTASYTLLQSLDAAATGASGGDVFGSQGFVRVGSASTPFTGTFTGQGNVISNLTIQDATNGHVEFALARIAVRLERGEVETVPRMPAIVEGVSRLWKDSGAIWLVV